jgi:hypothetical protein
MTPNMLIAACGGVVATVIAIGSLIWRLSSLLTALSVQRASMAEEMERMLITISELREAIKRVEAIPLHEQRITQLESICKAQQSQISDMWRKLYSADKHLAVLRSQSEHDISDSDRPEKEA